MEERVLNRAARDQEFIMNVERVSGEKASDYESNEAFLEHIASNVYDNIIEIVHSLLKKEDEDWESYADRLCWGEHESVYSYMEWWNYSAFLWDRRDHENSNSDI